MDGSDFTKGGVTSTTAIYVTYKVALGKFRLLMTNRENNTQSEEIEALYKRFEALLSGNSLSNEEKHSLSQEILKIVYRDRKEVEK